MLIHNSLRRPSFCRESGTTFVHKTDSSLEMFTAHIYVETHLQPQLDPGINQPAYFVGLTGVAKKDRMNSFHGASSFRLKLYSSET
jgi:hypothetical protein